MDFPNTEVSPPTKTKNGTLVQGAHGEVQEILTKLLPFTQYAFYVETMMAITSPNTTTGRSDIVYFTTTESSACPAGDGPRRGGTGWFDGPRLVGRGSRAQG